MAVAAIMLIQQLWAEACQQGGDGWVLLKIPRGDIIDKLDFGGDFDFALVCEGRGEWWFLLKNPRGDINGVGEDEVTNFGATRTSRKNKARGRAAARGRERGRPMT